MDPAKIAIIMSSLAAATRYGFELAELLKAANAGEIDEAEALARFERASEQYAAARDAWDAAGRPPEV